MEKLLCITIIFHIYCTQIEDYTAALRWILFILFVRNIYPSKWINTSFAPPNTFRLMEMFINNLFIYFGIYFTVCLGYLLSQRTMINIKYRFAFNNILIYIYFGIACVFYVAVCIRVWMWPWTLILGISFWNEKSMTFWNWDIIKCVAIRPTFDSVSAVSVNPMQGKKKKTGVRQSCTSCTKFWVGNMI